MAAPRRTLVDERGLAASFPVLDPDCASAEFG
jgi:hypothetical protein